MVFRKTDLKSPRDLSLHKQEKDAEVAALLAENATLKAKLNQTIGLLNSSTSTVPAESLGDWPGVTQLT